MSYYIGVDLGGTRIKIGIAKNESVITMQAQQANRMAGFKSNMLLIEKAITQLCKLHQIDKDAIKGIGFAFPGLVNSEDKKVISTNGKYDEAVNFDWKEWSFKYGGAISLENDARMACIGEWKYGAGMGYTDFVLVTIGTGIGTAVVINNKLLYGKHFQAGNLGGHFTVNYNGRMCTCGNRGCVEAEASSDILTELVNENSRYNKNKGQKLDFEMVFKSNEANKAMRDIRNQCIEVWSQAIVNYIHAYDPEVVIIGGGVLKSNEIIPHIQGNVHRQAWTPLRKVKVIGSKMNDSAGIYGAIKMANQVAEINKSI